MAGKPPLYPPLHRFSGSTKEIRRDPLVFFDRVLAAHLEDPVVRVRFGPVTDHFILDPTAARDLMTRSHGVLRRPWFFNRVFKEISGINLFTSEGDVWASKRKLIGPAFHSRRIAALADRMVRIADTTASGWVPGEQRDLVRAMTGMTLRIAGDTMFGVDLTEGQRGRELTAAFEGMVTWVDHRIARLFTASIGWPTRKARAARRAIDSVDRIVTEIVESRRREGSVDRDDLLQLLLDSRTEAGESLSTETVIAEAKAFFFAGHETTASALAFAWLELAENPHVREALDVELSEVLGGRLPTFDDLDRLLLTRRIIDETLRLHPPAPAIVRVLRRPARVAGYRIPRYRPVLILSYAMQRHPAHWTRPEVFDPDRFLPDRAAERHSHAYIPFGLGPRLCVGSRFALTEATLALATIAQKWHLDVRDGFIPAADTRFVLKPVSAPATPSPTPPMR